MSIERVLREEVEALLASKSASINTKPTSPLSKRIRCEDQPSVFHSTWQMISNPFDARVDGARSTAPTDVQEDFSDFSSSMAGIESNVFKCQLSDDEVSLQSFELSETGLLSQANFVGPPSLQDSMAELFDSGSRTGDVAITEKPNRVKKRHSSRILDHANLGQIPSCPSSTKEMSRKSSPKPSGLNMILDSNTSVGSTYRGSASSLGPSPRGACDYVMRLMKSEHESKSDEIPDRIYKYPSGNSLRSDGKAKCSSETPVVKEGPLFSPINKTFLDSVNEQIQHIKYEQAKEKLELSLSLSSKPDEIGVGDNASGERSCSGQSVIWEADIRNLVETISIGTTRSDTEGLNSVSEITVPTRADLCIQTDASDITSSLNSPNPWGTTSKVDSQISLTALKGNKLGCHRSNLKQSFYPINPDVQSDDCISRSRTLPRPHLHRSSSFFGNFINFNNAMGITRYSLQAAWNTAEEIFYGCIVPQEIENVPPIEDNVEENEDRMAVSVMRLMGVSTDTRNAIYREVLGEIQALNDFSVGTVQAISNVIDWICTGNHNGTEDLIAKTRLLCTSQTEVDPDSETWKGFERDMRIFTNAVVKTMGNAARVVSRQYAEDSNDSLQASVSSPASQSYIGLETDSNENPAASCIKFRIPESLEDLSSQVNTSISEHDDYDAPINPELMAKLVTPSEFDLPVTPVVPGAESTTSKSSTHSCVSRRRSKIPIRVNSAKSQEAKDPDENFNLSVLKSALRYDKNDAYSHGFRNSKSRLDALSDEKPLSRQASYSTYVNAYMANRLKKGESPGASNCSLPTMSKTALRPGESNRERFLCPEDALLLKECRRLTSMSNSDKASPFSCTESGSLYESRTGSPSSYLETTMGSERSQSRSILSTDISHLASTIASVATSVTSTLLTRAGSAASYIPSFSDTFGPQVDEECRLPECSPEGPTSFLDSLQEAASNMIFGYDDPIFESNGRVQRPVRSNNRFAMSPECGSRPASDDRNNNDGRIHGTQLGSQATTSLRDDNGKIGKDAAWELFDYIKRGETEKTRDKMQMAAHKFNERGIIDQSPPDFVESPAEPSVTARLSKAALTGLFNTFTESIPPPSASLPQSDHCINIREQQSFMQPRAQSPTPTKSTQGSQKYQTCSGHNYILNSQLSSHANLRSQTPSIPMIFAPQNSDTGFSVNAAQLRMKEDMAHLESVIKQYYNENLTKVPVKETPAPTSVQQRSRSHQQATGKSKIPIFGPKATENKTSKKVTQPSNSTLKSTIGSSISLDTHVTSFVSVMSDNSTSSLQFCTGPGNKSFSRVKPNNALNNGHPKIVHPAKAPMSNRVTPLKTKPRVQVLDVSQKPPHPPSPKYTGSNRSSGSNSIAASRTPSYASTNATSNSYLNMARQKEMHVPKRTPGRGIGSYSSTNRHLQQDTHQEGQGVGNPKNVKQSTRKPSQVNKTDVSGYKYDDGTIGSDPGSSLCSSTCSTGRVSTNTSAHHSINSANRNQNESMSYNMDKDGSNDGQVKNAPLFFPTLDTSPLPLPPLLVNPFSRFRRSEESKDTNQVNVPI